MKNFKFLLILFSTVLCTAQAGWYPKKLDNILIDGTETTVVVHAYRDYMPGINRGGSGLIVGFQIEALDETKTFPHEIQIIKAIAQEKEKTWDMTTSENKDVYNNTSSTGYRIVFRNGPKWSVNSYLDISLTIKINQQTYQINAGNIVLGKTS